jgi:hypothetical protein
MKKILFTVAILMIAMTAMTSLSACSHCGHKAGKTAEACCNYAGTAACCGHNAPDAKISCAGCGGDVAAKDALKVADGKYACGHCAVAMGGK